MLRRTGRTAKYGWRRCLCARAYVYPETTASALLVR